MPWNLLDGKHSGTLSGSQQSSCSCFCVLPFWFRGRVKVTFWHKEFIIHIQCSSVQWGEIFEREIPPPLYSSILHYTHPFILTINGVLWPSVLSGMNKGSSGWVGNLLSPQPRSNCFVYFGCGIDHISFVLWPLVTLEIFSQGPFLESVWFRCSCSKCCVSPDQSRVFPLPPARTHPHAPDTASCQAELAA